MYTREIIYLELDLEASIMKAFLYIFDLDSFYSFYFQYEEVAKEYYEQEWEKLSSLE